MTHRLRFDPLSWLFRDSSSSKKVRTQPVRKSRHKFAKPVLQFERLESRQLLTGDFVWVNAVGSTGSDIANAVVTDSAGNVYTTGTFAGTVDFDPGTGTAFLTSAGSTDIFVIKVDSSGALLWTRSMGGDSEVGPTTFAEQVNAIAVDSAGNVYTTGYFYGTADFNPGPGAAINELVSAGQSDVFVSRLDNGGNFVWAKRMGGTGRDQANGIAVDATGSILTTGSFELTADFNPGNGVNELTSGGSSDIFVSRLTSSGNYGWARGMNGTSVDGADGIALDASGNVFITGSFSGTIFAPDIGLVNLISAGVSDVFVSKLNSGGNFIWARRMGGTNFDATSSIAVDSTGNVLTTGTFIGTSDFDPGSDVRNLSSASAGLTDIFVSKLDSGGNFIWAQRMGGVDSDSPKKIATDPAGNIYSTGSLSGTADFDPGPNVENLSSDGGSDIFLSKLDPNGNHVWARRMGGTGTDSANGMALDSAGNIYVVGGFRFIADFDPGFGNANRTSAGSFDAFTLKLSPDMLFDLSGLFGDVKLVRNGDMLDLFYNGTLTGGNYILFDQEPISDIRSVRINNSIGLGNSLTLDFLAGGTFSFDGGIHYAAGSAATDVIRFVGRANEGFTYAPALGTEFAGTMRTYGDDVTFTSVEFVFMTNSQALSLETQGSTDALTVSAGNGFLGHRATTIAGTSGGTAMASITLDRVRDLTIDMGAQDGALAQSNDNITFASGSLEAVGLQNLTVLGGKGADNMVVNSADLGLPGSGSVFRFEGGAGNDRLAVNGNTDYRLNDLRLTSTAGGFILHDEVERAALSGGASNNTMIAVGYSGALTINGLAGNDVMWGGTGTNSILGGTGDDQLHGNARNDSLDGGDGNDQLFGGLGNDSLNGGAGLDLLWFDGSSNSDNLKLQFLTVTTANFVRKPRGLQSVLEQDSIVYDATDEVLINALDGDDLITVDAAFAILGLIDGGNGTDTCTAPAAWTKASC